MMLVAISSFMLLLMFLTIPVNYCINGHKQELFWGEIRVRWLWGSVDVLYSYDSHNGFNSYKKFLGKTISVNNCPDKDKAVVSKARGFDFRYLLDKALLQKAIGLLTEILNHIKPQIFRVNGKIGLDNPYYTAMTIGIISSLNFPDVYIEPVFDQEIIEGSLVIRGRLVIGIAVILLIKFLITKPVRNILIKLIKNKGEKSYVH